MNPEESPKNPPGEDFCLLSDPRLAKASQSGAEVILEFHDGVRGFRVALSPDKLHQIINQASFGDAADGKTVVFVLNRGDCCPVCGSDDIEALKGASRKEGGKVLQRCECKSCGAVWDARYQAEGFDLVKEPVTPANSGNYVLVGYRKENGCREEVLATATGPSARDELGRKVVGLWLSGYDGLKVLRA